jgi:uncharacterized protein
MRELEIFVFSIFSSTLAPIFGIGGGLINVPFLTLYIGVPFAAATTAALFAGIFVSTSASAFNIQRRTVDLNTAYRLLPAFILGSLISAFLPLPDRWLYVIFGVVTLLVAIISFSKYSVKLEIKNPIISSIFLFITGAIAGVIGISGGPILVPFLYFTQGKRGKEAIATSSFMTIFGLVGSFGSHLLHGDMDWTVAIPLVIPAIVMGYVGAYIMTEKISKEKLRNIFGVFLVLVGILMTGRAFGINI